MRTHPIVEYYQALRDSAPCLSRAATLPKGTKLGLGKRRAPGNTIILSQPYRRRVSTDRLNREGSQLAASLEGEPGPTPAGKTLPHSFPETRYRRRVSTDRLNREGSQLAASLEGEPGPTPAGKTLPHSFPETSRFRRERARVDQLRRLKCVVTTTRLFSMSAAFSQLVSALVCDVTSSPEWSGERLKGVV